jgi:hypothetical protein
MNYYGNLHKSLALASEVYTFLRQALRQVDVNLPLRGPSAFQHGDFTYSQQSTGRLDHFEGSERIAFKGEEIFTLSYHGGSVR